MTWRDRTTTLLAVAGALCALLGLVSLTAPPAVAASGAGRIYQVTSLGGSPASYQLVVDATAGMAAGDHVMAFVSGGASALYSITSVGDATTVTVQDALTEENGGEFGAPVTGRYVWGTPTGNGLSRVPDSAVAFNAALRRNAHLANAAADLSAVTITGGTLSGVSVSSVALSTATVTGGTLAGTVVNAGTISGGTLSGVTLDGVALTTVDVETGTIDAFFAGTITLGGGPQVLTGSGSPVGIVVADVGSTFARQDGSANTTLYVKESGSGTSSGWVAADIATPAPEAEDLVFHKGKMVHFGAGPSTSTQTGSSNFGGWVTLTHAAATTVFSFPVGLKESAGVTISYAVSLTSSSSEQQCESGRFVGAVARNNAGTWVVSPASPSVAGDLAQALTAGTLALDWSVANDGTNAIVKANATSSLTPLGSISLRYTATLNHSASTVPDATLP